MKAPIYNLKFEKIGETVLPKEIFDVSVSDQLISQSIRVYLANQRSSFAKAKSRGQIRGTTKKVWAQKGTGNARHGSRKAPIFVGGGSAMGPDGNQNYTLKINKKMKRQAINGILTKFAKANKIIIIDEFKDLKPKTKDGIKFITGLKAVNKVLSESSKIGIITSQTLNNIKRAFNNLSKINLLSLKSLNIYDLSNQNFLILSQKSVKDLIK
ncbi:MAG: 50S ribosomal protein L4 [Candidatus Shapirobacteria bacterium]|nr:50S ribosomal protein L4 [Candidatus Shapirobacteria bacterium]